MRETIITVAGNVGGAPTYFAASEGRSSRLVLSVATTRRVRDQESGTWRDANTSWYDVWLNGRLADHARESIGKGDAVIATGPVEIRRWEDGDRNGHKAVISARSFGPDLSKSPVQISRVRVAATPDDEEPTDVTGYTEVAEEPEDAPAAGTDDSDAEPSTIASALASGT